MPTAVSGACGPGRGPHLLAALREHYGLDGHAEADLGGSSSLNLLVRANGRRYVARVHRPHVTRERLGAIQQVRAALLAGGVPCAPALPTLRGESAAAHQGRLLEVEHHVDHDAVMRSWTRLEAGMAMLAQAHEVLATLDLGEPARWPRYANHLEPADVLTGTRRGTARIRGWGPTAEEADLAAAAERLAELLAEGEAGLVPRLPRQLVHGDFWDDNVLFRRERPVLLADFDFMGERARVDDLALTLWCAGSDVGATAGPDRLRGRLTRLVAAYDAALVAPLSAAERPRCRRPWLAIPCPRSRDGWRGWTTTMPPAGTPPRSRRRCRRRYGCWPTWTAGGTPSPRPLGRGRQWPDAPP